jgi:homocysteine S-methyltransferase
VRSSVRLAQEAREIYCTERPETANAAVPVVAGSAGCYGAYLADGSEYRGNYGRAMKRLVEFHRPRVEWLAEAGADVLAFETLPCLTEAEAVVELLAEFPEVPAWVAFSCRDGAHVCEGQTIDACTRAVAAAPNVIAIGVNCTVPGHVAGLIPRLVQASDRLVIVYPNRGEGWDPETGRWIPSSVSLDFGELAIAWYELGARLIGGCCRTTPNDVRAIAGALESV